MRLKGCNCVGVQLLLRLPMPTTSPPLDFRPSKFDILRTLNPGTALFGTVATVSPGKKQYTSAPEFGIILE